LAYPDFSKVFEIYTDASMMQLGAVITQDPHKNQKWIYKIKMLQIDQLIVYNFKFIVSQIRLFYLIIKFNFLTNAKNGSKNINFYK
jgi:hypothetical protein